MTKILAPDGVTYARSYLIGTSGGSGFSGASRGFGNQLDDWYAPHLTPDQALLPSIRRGHARADDIARNNGIGKNAIQLHKDHIVGDKFRLSYKPNWRVLGVKESEATKEFVKDVEALFAIIGDGTECLLDAERKRTFTGLIRSGVEMHTVHGDIFAKPEWVEEQSRSFCTAIKLVSPKRISNPGNRSDTERCRAGIQVNTSNAATGYYVAYGGDRVHQQNEWRYIPQTIKGGRRGMIHIFDPNEPDQTRGANEFLAVMEQMKMLDTLQQTKLQSAIINAMYAATIESELNSDQAFEYIAGASGDDDSNPITQVLSKYAEYYSGNKIKLGGAKVPHLFPGDQLKLSSPSNSDNGFSQLEQSLIRYIAAGTGFSYEELSRNYTSLSYSTARASANNSWRYVMGQRKLIANRLATEIFALFLEEALIRGWVTPPKGARFSFWEMRAAWVNCEWIGSGRMAIDGLKEVRESIMLIENGLSTYEHELAKMGKDYTETFQQQVREMEERKKAGLPLASWDTAEAIAPEANDQQEAA